jgi:hypothetical protein
VSRRDALPRQISSKRRASVRNTLIAGAIVVGALLGIPALVLASQASTVANNAMTAAQDRAEPLHRPFAEVVAARWAAGSLALPTAGEAYVDFGRPPLEETVVEDLNLNESQLVDGRVPIEVLSVTWHSAQFHTDTANNVSEIHRMLVSSPTGLWWLVIPIVQVPDNNQPALGARPHLEPYLIGADIDTVVPLGWATGMVPVPTVDQNVIDRITEWAEAYAADNRRALYELTGDSRPDIEYAGLPGFTLAAASVESAATIDAVTMVVRVTLTLLGRGGVQFSSDYDVLVGGYGQPLPSILAWGPPGIGQRLTTGVNAVVAGTTYAPLTDLTDPPLRAGTIDLNEPAGDDAAADEADETPEPPGFTAPPADQPAADADAGPDPDAPAEAPADDLPVPVTEEQP